MALGQALSTFDDGVLQRLSSKDCCEHLELARPLKTVGNEGARRWEGGLSRSDADGEAILPAYIVKGCDLLDLSLATWILPRDRL